MRIRGWARLSISALLVLVGSGGLGGAIVAPAEAASSGTLGFAQIEGYWVAAGGPASNAATAAAIAGAESSYYPGIIQSGQPYSTTGWGLWQITPGSSVSQFGRDYQLLDPWNNAGAAVAKYRAAGNSFRPWTTYNNGAYRQFLPGSPPSPAGVTDPGQYVPINSAPSGTYNTSQPGTTFGPTMPGTTSGTADVYGALADGRLTYSKIDVATGNRTHSVNSTAKLGFTPKAMATLNFNTVLVTTSGGTLYRVDIGTNNTSLTFTKTLIGTGWTHDRLVYDGNSHLFGIAAGALRRYNLTAAKPAATSITGNTLIDNGFTLKTLTSTAPDWIIGTDAAGELLSYHITGANSWTRYVLKSSTWGGFTSLTSPGGGVYYGRAASGAMFRYLDANPTDGSGSDLQGFSSDPVDTSGWTQVVISARPNAV
jgi:Lysozyme like domain/Tachylectin